MTSVTAFMHPSDTALPALPRDARSGGGQALWTASRQGTGVARDEEQGGTHGTPDHGCRAAGERGRVARLQR
ncbi:hypothetical protein HTV45_26325 [Streptomyces sp. CHD11]|uniref:hypothetical protein n=1 Tax=Streptomyces sp. CHD11 TaxID=2741325 RepID=UPI001BFC6287|nr:hypothetical protein [Streptomyces sp. CHD11]MBT3154348.1 hypothetical protein [Streptomyces sp. CHD11]